MLPYWWHKYHLKSTSYSRCDPRGTTAPCDSSGNCFCKQNVEGDSCDRCRPGSFGLDANNPNGCLSCYCSGVSSDCHEVCHLNLILISYCKEHIVPRCWFHVPKMLRYANMTLMSTGQPLHKGADSRAGAWWQLRRFYHHRFECRESDPR